MKSKRIKFDLGKKILNQSFKGSKQYLKRISLLCPKEKEPAGT